MVVLGLVTSHCHPVLASPPCGMLLSPPHDVSMLLHVNVTLLHLLAMLLLSHVVVFVLCHCHQVVVVPSCVSMRWVWRKVRWGVLTKINNNN